MVLEKFSGTQAMGLSNTSWSSQGTLKALDYCGHLEKVEGKKRAEGNQIHLEPRSRQWLLESPKGVSFQDQLTATSDPTGW